ncbi:Strictosidine synthase, partial [Theobroma cacao]
MKIFHSFKLLFFVLFLSQNIIQSFQQLPEGDDLHKNYYQMDLPQVTGPESIAFDCKNRGPYVGVSDGRILKWQGPNLGWKEFAIPSSDRNRKVCDGSTNPDLESTCGRPLGLKFNSATCDLYIADAYFGLLLVGPNGGVAQQLATSAEGVPFKFTNALDINTNTGEVTVLYKGLAFPNGVALSKDNSFLLVAETTKMRILKFNLDSTTDSYIPEQFAQLPKMPDNIKRNHKGEFWVALNSGRGRIQNDGETKFSVETTIRWFTLDPVGVKYDQEGKIMKQLDGNGGIWFDSVSEVEELNGKLYIGSV